MYKKILSIHCLKQFYLRGSNRFLGYQHHSQGDPEMLERVRGSHLQALCSEFYFSGNYKGAGKESRMMCHEGMGREHVLTCFLWLFRQIIKQKQL